MIPFWCPRAETFLTDWFTSGKPRRLLYRHTHNKKRTTERPNRSARRRRSLRLHQLLHQVSRKNIGKKTKIQTKNQTILPPSFFFNFLFLFFFTSSDLLFSASAAAFSFNYLKAISTTTTKSLLYGADRRVFFSSWKKERKVEIHKHKEWLEVCGHSPPLPMWWNGRFDGNNSLKSTTH